MEIYLEVIEKLLQANYVVVLTGAGVSAESGISTFRDPNGLWAKFSPMELASIEGFLSNPQRVWDWYQYRRNILNKAKPNSGHYAIAEMGKLFRQFSLITQNVDRLHQAARSSDVIELHGNIIENHCFSCKKPYPVERNLPDKDIPRCPDCGGLIRPSVVWFGEMLPIDALQKAENASANCDIFFSIGTSAEVYPAASLPYVAKQNGAILVEVNPNYTQLTSFVDYHIHETSEKALPELVSTLKKAKGIYD